MPMPSDDRIQSLIESHYRRNDPLGWFEPLYATAGGDPSIIPWADEQPNRHLVQWLDRERVVGGGRRAIVVGCGLGDDGEELARRGFEVTAFDLASSAIEWARRRFPRSSVRYEVADLLALPAGWEGAFDFVFEAYTIQAMPRSLRARAIDAVAALVKPGGELLVVCRGREDDEDEGSLPWPLSHEEIGRFEATCGLVRVAFENFMDTARAGQAPVRRFRAHYHKR